MLQNKEEKLKSKHEQLVRIQKLINFIIPTLKENLNKINKSTILLKVCILIFQVIFKDQK